MFVERVMIENTIEQRLCALQEKKQSITNGALGEGGAAGEWIVSELSLSVQE